METIVLALQEQDVRYAVQTEFMISWAKENPELFFDKFNKFFDDYPASEWEHKSVARKGYITLIANKE